MHLRLVPRPQLALTAGDLAERLQTARVVNGENDSGPAVAGVRPEVALTESAQAAALLWLVLAGVTKPKGSHVLEVARRMVASLDIPPPMWALRPAGPVIESIERMRDEMLVYDESGDAAPAS